ncbi:MAG: thiosulfate sulfurtransferase GlpE [Candidatus Omnitrophica bacterium]|nr:thiosulfate sulfurtransferase GlpE [Candidatus Omnitrophota bacterium]
MENFQEIDAHEAKNIIDRDNAIVVDIRDPASFTEGHIPGARQLTQEDIDSFVNETDKSAPLIFCCYHGFSSQQAAAYFVQQGFENVYSLKGGFEAWLSEYPS